MIYQQLGGNYAISLAITVIMQCLLLAAGKMI